MTERDKKRADKDAKSKDVKAAKPSRRQRKKEVKKKLSKTGKYILVAIGVAAMALSVTAMACSGVLNQVTSSEDYQLTGGVAATVDGVNITEDTITEQIMSIRTSYGYESDDDWAQYLVDSSLTPESLRESYINSYAEQYLLEKAETEYNIEVTDDEIQEAYDDAVSSYGDEDSFTSLITAMGYTEETYKSSLESSLAQSKLKEEVAPEEDPTDDEVISYFNENFDTYNDARRSQNLLISVDSDATDDEKAEAQAKAQEALDKINSGELSFEEAVEEYSDDTSSKEDGGDVGWDKLTSFVTEYQSALNELEKDQVSGIVESSYGYHIIKCTDTFKLDADATSIDQLPDEFQEYIENVLKTQNQTTAYNEWLEEYTEAANITINDMPENVPYNVSLDGVIPTSEQTTSGSAAADSGSSEQ